MIEAGIGRLLVASLHQGIADLLPTRLEFYEAWLNPAGLRDGKIGLAPLAVTGMDHTVAKVLEAFEKRGRELYPESALPNILSAKLRAARRMAARSPGKTLRSC